jgi:hypothetical protein
VKETAVEIVKIVLPALLSSILTTFYFQKRLRRLGDFQEATKTLLQRFIEGANEVFQMAQKLDMQVQEVSNELERVPIDIAKLHATVHDLCKHSEVFRTVLSDHRIYITSLLPFGESGGYNAFVRHISGFISILYSPEGLSSTPEEQEEMLSATREAIKGMHKEFLKLRETLDRCHKNILDGKLP